MLIVLVIILLAYYLENDDNDDFLVLLSAFSTTANEVIMTDEDSINNYSSLIKNLDQKLNDSIYSGNYSSYESVEINGNADTKLKEVLSFLAVLKEQDIEYINENIDAIKSLHSKMYKIEKDVSTEYCSGCYCNHGPKSNCPGNCKCSGHKTLKIDIISNTFEDMLVILNFDEEQKEWARRLVDNDYKELYENFE